MKSMPPFFSTQGPGLDIRVIRDCIGYCGRISVVLNVPHLPQNLFGHPQRRPWPAYRPRVHYTGVGDCVRPHIIVPVVATPKELFNTPEEGLIPARVFLRSRLGERIQGGVVCDPGRPDVPVFGLPHILHVVKERHVLIGGFLPPAPGPGGHGRPVRDGVGPHPNVASGVQIPHPVEDPLGRLGRSLPADVGQARDYGVVSPDCRPGPFVLISVPPVLLWRFA